MAKRLTPYLTRRALDLPLADKAMLMGQLRASIQMPESPEARLRYLAGKMQGVAGVDVGDNGHQREIVAARNIFIFVARREGFTQECIGRFIGRTHATVCIAEKKMREVFTYPKSYIQEIDLYNRYVESL